MEPYIGVITYFGGNFAPRGFAMCRGQLLSIAQESALFAILGTYYGGNGQTTFSLPDLGGRTALGTGTSTAGGFFDLGQVDGTEQTTLTMASLPMHVHGIQLNSTLQACSGVGAGDESAVPQAGMCLGSVLDGDGKSSPVLYAPAGSGTAVNLQGGRVSGTTGIAGANQPVSIMQPYLAMTAMIAMEGIFPSRN